MPQSLPAPHWLPGETMPLLVFPVRTRINTSQKAKRDGLTGTLKTATETASPALTLYVVMLARYDTRKARSPVLVRGRDIFTRAWASRCMARQQQ